MEDAVNIYREAVVSEVRALIGRRRTSQVEVAKAIGLSRSTFNRRMLCELPFDLDDVLGLARHFNVSVSTLVPEPVETATDQRRRQSACITADELAARRRTTANVAPLLKVAGL